VPNPSRRARGLPESPIRKLDLAVGAATGVRFFKLNIGQPDVPTPEPLRAAIRDFDTRVIDYGPASGTPACRDAAAAWFSRFGGPFERKHVAVTTGGSEALLFAFTALCDAGDEILVPEPYYTNYNGFATVAGARVVPVRTRLADGFALPSDAALDAAVTERTRAIVFSNPSNPTGAVTGRADLARLLAWAARRDLFVVADEVYRQIWFEAPPTSALSFPEHADRVICVDSLSKTWSACGIRVGFVCSRNETIMSAVERLGQARLGAQPLGQAVGIAALGMDEAYYEALRAIYRSRVGVLVSALESLPGVTCSRPAGAFYVMAGLPVSDSDRFARWLVTDFRDRGESVVVAPGGGFYASAADGAREVRLAAVLHEDGIARGVELLGKALAAFPN
jgi:aspartate aminotransferase